MQKINKETLGWIPKWKITKFNKGETTPYEVSEFGGNLLTNAGMNHLWKIICGDAVDDLETAPMLIVGTGSGAATVDDEEGDFTAGVKESAKYDSHPTFGTDQKATWSAEYDGDTANQAWAEFGLLTKETDGVLINRKVSAQGTKVSGQTWILSLEITLSNPA
jgi:hypothetical protein